ncbi:dihydrolipoyllysine-residue acetyltransferase component of pyruvate dehydrogenase complex [Antarctobacter heliothermus]|uniref:Acetyltransferase component of pyruvate dehydrogenase complex n=1 Tax=Antarctobacter heliothermus TaxID=74033 RepID=A0A222E642_9RHOB|nr:pyruvate dehydrogenase complex dihydrolipoamide acetyltransferase [Antarctobacter heliothermus]ASP21689.1 dihydrolipoyllysine-residue acetyltransferase component of pyruvate dehydrogenase complex [Antarctobacter heliothermus]
MPIKILMPALSPTMEDGTLAKWLVKEGDTVSSGDVIAEIETDKATMEFEAVDEGTIGRILVAEGTTNVKVNDPIAVLLEDGESTDDISDGPVATAPQAQATAAAEAAPTSGGSEKAAPTAPRNDTDRVFASPLARRLADQKGLDLSQITGSGPRGRIVKADVEAATSEPVAAAPAPVEKTPQTAVSSDAISKIYADRPHKEIALDGMRRTVAARLTEAKQTIPHFYLRREIRLDALMNFRKQINDQLAPRGIKLSINDFIIKACADALQRVPAANAVWAGDRILQLTPSDVAVAVAVEGGLFTPVLRDAHQKTLSALSSEMKDLAARARDRKLAPHEYQGGSFAISNLGMFGIENFDAVINPPHGAILAVGAGIKKPVVYDNGEIGIATVMSVTLSVDHRVIDGALGAELLNAIVEGLQNPLALLA